MSQLQHPGTERKFWRDCSTNANILTTDNYSAAFLRLITCLPGFTIFVQRVNFSVNVENASEITVQSSDATPVKVAEINAPSSEGPNDFDFGEVGIAIPEGKHLEFRNSAAGMGVNVYVQAYMKPTGTFVAKAAGMGSSDFTATL